MIYAEIEINSLITQAIATPSWRKGEPSTRSYSWTLGCRATAPAGRRPSTASTRAANSWTTRCRAGSRSALPTAFWRRRAYAPIPARIPRPWRTVWRMWTTMGSRHTRIFSRRRRTYASSSSPRCGRSLLKKRSTGSRPPLPRLCYHFSYRIFVLVGFCY